MNHDMISDHLLRSVLDCAAETRAQCVATLEYLDRNRLAASASPDEASELELSRQQKLLTAQLARLRGLHRKAIYEARATKQQTSEAKSEIDTLHLQLQNLFYEQKHLSGEISACEDYDHKYQTLPLVTTDEFLASHIELTGANEHDMMVARIGDELTRRQALEEQRQALLKKKQSLITENKKKKDELDTLDKEIEKFINGSASVQKIFSSRDQSEPQLV